MLSHLPLNSERRYRSESRVQFPSSKFLEGRDQISLNFATGPGSALSKGSLKPAVIGE